MGSGFIRDDGHYKRREDLKGGPELIARASKAVETKMVSETAGRSSEAAKRASETSEKA